MIVPSLAVRHNLFLTDKLMKTIDLYTARDLSEDYGVPHRTILEHARNGTLPKSCINFPVSRGYYVWTAQKLKAAGREVPKKASLQLDIS